ncbi:MAG TPA: IPT/TIG domain-containing protein [Vicinamibacteria bacterium]|nr:IPT/TIG domain-containing protein [Vicinamibacteria bacterium]
MADANPEMPSLTVAGGPLDSYEMKLSPGTTVIIGSGRLAHMRVDHPEIELAHVKVTWDDTGISMIDNGSRKGTWVNGEPVETVLLLDGDVIEFTAPDSKSKPPKIKVRIPKGSVPEPPPLPPPAPGEVASRPAPPARAAAPRARGPARRRRAGPSLPDLRLVGVAAGALVLLAGGGLLVRRVFFTAPQLASVEPGQAEPGQTVTIRGKRFRSDAGDNTVWFGELSVAAQSASGDALQVRVPHVPRPGPVPVAVQTSGGRSRPVSFVALAPLIATSLDPGGALAGDQVVLGGTGFGDGAIVTVGGAPARVISAAAGELRFEMPALQGAPGSRQDVVVSVGSRRTQPLPLYLGRLPLVLSFDPARGVAGDLVRIRGRGFAPTADGNVVSFDGEPALVLAASPEEMAVVVPPLARAQAETMARVAVQAGGKTSSEGTTFQVQRLMEGTWVLRFLAGPVGDGGGKGQAVVATELAPVLLLSGKDEARSVGERAWRLASALNGVADRARVGQAAAFEAREQPAIGVGVVGAPDVLVRVTAEDAAAYQSAPGAPARVAPPAPLEIARYWAALLGDTVVVATSGGKPAALAAASPAAGAALAQLRAVLPWQYGSGIANARVAAVPADLRRRLRDAAFRLP